jgi:hypothetical protein
LRNKILAACANEAELSIFNNSQSERDEGAAAAICTFAPHAENLKLAENISCSWENFEHAPPRERQQMKNQRRPELFMANALALFFARFFAPRRDSSAAVETFLPLVTCIRNIVCGQIACYFSLRLLSSACSFQAQ